MSDDDKPLDPEAAKIVAKVRRLMMIASATTMIAVAVVVAVIGYRVFRAGGSAPSVAEVEASIPVASTVISTAVAEGRIVLTIQTITGEVELHTFDLNTLKPLGRLRLQPGP